MTERATDIKDTDSTGSVSRETSGEATATAQAAGAHPAPFNIRRRIGSTAYEVEVHFSAGRGETMDDKILRLVRGGAANGKDGENEKS